MGESARLSCVALLVWLSACAGEGRAPAPPQAKQPSILDRAVEPAVKTLGGRVGPQGGIVFPSQPQP